MSELLLIKGAKLAFGLVTSYVANNIPTIKELLGKRDDIKDRLESSYIAAVKKLEVDQGTKDALMQGTMERRLNQLRDFVTHPEHGRHPWEREFLNIWANLIWADPTCNTFLLKNEIAINNAETQKLLADIQKSESEINEKISQLLSRGEVSCKKYWERKSIAEDIQIPYSIILKGRDEARNAVENAFNKPAVVYIKAETKQEAKAFASAVVLANGDEIQNRSIVIENIDNYRELAEKDGNEIIITSITGDSPWLAKSHGHSVIICAGMADALTTKAIIVPAIDREGFVESLIEAGLEENVARRAASEASFDINCLWRDLQITKISVDWENPKYNSVLLPAILFGGWNDSFPNDTELIELLSGVKYEEYKNILVAISAEESPFNNIGSEWKLKDPRTMIGAYKDKISTEYLNKFFDCVDWLLEDDDPDAIAKRDAKMLQAWNDKHAYSSAIKEGAFLSLALLSCLSDKHSETELMISTYIHSKLKDFTIERYLSNKNTIRWFAEAAPEAVLEFVENDMRKGASLMSQIFEVKVSDAELTGTRIFYTDILYCLERIAWDEELLPRVTDVLVKMCAFKNESNWLNRPINSLYRIYRFMMPQTYATIEYRCKILEVQSKRNPSEIYTLCFKLLKGLDGTVLEPSERFQWRWNERYEEPKLLTSPNPEDIKRILHIALETCKWDKKQIEKWLHLSTSMWLGFFRLEILDEIRRNKTLIMDDEEMIHVLRKDIIGRNLACKDAIWALRKNQLEPYRALLQEIEPSDVISQNKHYFEEIFIMDPDAGIGVDSLEYSKRVRAEKLHQIIDELGDEGIWQLEKAAKSKDAVADGLVSLTQDQFCKVVYNKYVQGDLSDAFVLRYYSEIYYADGEELYLALIRELADVNADKIAIVLYAPSYHKTLASFAEQRAGSIAEEYWKSVSVWQIGKDDGSYVIDRMRRAQRYDDIMIHLFVFENATKIAENDKIDVLCEIYNNNKLDVLLRNKYQLAEVLRTISLPQDNRRNTILLIEFLLFEGLRHYLHGQTLHLLREINESPEMLMQIVGMVYLPEEPYRIPIPENQREFRTQLAHRAWTFLYYYSDVPCTKEDGSIDEIKLKGYIYRLIEIMREQHYKNVMPLIVGKILGNMPENEDYPSDTMCQLVEELNNDDIDTEIGCAVYNRRGMSTRMPYDGGKIEREYIELFEKYKRRASLRSPRLARVFDRTIKSYIDMARIEDEQAKRNRLMF